MAKLKPCPFCGSKVRVIQTRFPLPDFEDTDKGDFEIYCQKCNALTVFFSSGADIDERWNRRPFYV